MITLLPLALAWSVQADAGTEGWRETALPEGAVLSVGPPENATIRIVCARPGVLRTDLSGLYTGEGPEPRSVVVRSGRARASYRLSNRDGFSADIPATAPVMRAFRASGGLSFVAANAELEGMAAGPADVQIVSTFVRRCGG